MSKVRVELLSRGMKALLKDEGIRRDLLRRAEAVAAAARASAPVKTGEYKNGISATTAVTDRVVGRVLATAPHSLVVESRTGNLARSLSAGA